MDFPDALQMPAFRARTVKLTRRTMQEALEESLMGSTRAVLDEVLLDELNLVLPEGQGVGDFPSKRTLIQGFIGGWDLPRLVTLAELVCEELGEDSSLRELIEQYQSTGGVDGSIKNLIFAANGPKPELVLRDAVSNDIEITKNAEHCLVYDRPLRAEGLSFAELTEWWRGKAHMDDSDEPTVGRALWARLKESVAGSPVETLLYDTYSRRYGVNGYDIPALIPQVYLHYDPYTKAQRGAAGSPLARQRMDFLLLFSQRRRVVLEVDGRQHYADQDGTANTALYAAMVAEDRRLRLAGYEVYRFGGKELDGSTASVKLLETFFDELAARSGG